MTCGNNGKRNYKSISKLNGAITCLAFGRGKPKSKFQKSTTSYSVHGRRSKSLVNFCKRTIFMGGKINSSENQYKRSLKSVKSMASDKLTRLHGRARLV